MRMTKMKLAFGASVLALAANVNNAQAADPAEAPVNGDSTVVLMGKKASTTEPNRASFTIDVGSLSIGKQIGLATSQKMAIVFTGTGEEKNRACPFFNLVSRKYDIVETERNIFKITADIDVDAMKKIEAVGCMVTTRPDLNKIKYLPTEPRN